MSKLNKIFYFSLILLFALSLFLTSCSNFNKTSQGINLPQYIKDFSSTFNKHNIKLTYNPIEVKPAPAPNKPYPINERNIPEDWIEGELKWYTGEPYNPSNYLETDIVLFNDRYILEKTVDKNFKAPSSNPSVKRTIFKLYERKIPNTPFPKTITNSDFVLIKTLDKLSENSKNTQNALGELTDKFVVWVSYPFEYDIKWTIWGYDINDDSIFEIYSHNDAEKEFKPCDVPRYNIIEEKNFLVIDITGEDIEGNLKNKVIFYDLSKRQIARTFESNTYKRQYFLNWWTPSSLHLIDGYLYGEKFYLKNSKNISGQYILSDIIRVNLNTWNEETFIEKGPFRLVSSFPDGKISFVPYIKNYPCHDIWLCDLKENKMNCVEKICYSEPASTNSQISSDVPSYLPKVLISAKGVQYVYSEEKTGEKCSTFYSYKEKKIYYDYDFLGFIDNEGKFYMPKSPYALFNPLPPFDFQGKEDLLEGYDVYLIIQPK